MTCHNCGAENTPDSMFCTMCGKPIDMYQQIVQYNQGIPKKPVKTRTADKPAGKILISLRRAVCILIPTGLLVVSLIYFIIAISAAVRGVRLYVSNHAEVQLVLESAREKWNSGAHRDAVSFLSDANKSHDSHQLESLYEEYSNQYAQEVLENADKYVLQGEYNYAIRDLTWALELLPKHSGLQEKLRTCQWTEVLYSDSNYQIVRKDFDSYDSYSITVGVMDGNYEWIQPLSTRFIFAKAIQDESGRATLNGSRTSVGSRNICYLGEGVFILSLGISVIDASGSTLKSVGSYYSVSDSGLTCYLFNANTGTQATFSAVWITPVYQGNMLMYNSSRYNSNFYRVSSEGVVTELPVRHSVNDYGVSGYAEGLFFANGYFYDIYGHTVLDLTSYNLVNTPYFVDGTCEIRFKNDGNTTYSAVIDKSGKIISGPNRE